MTISHKLYELIVETIRHEKLIAHEHHENALKSRSGSDYALYNIQMVERDKHTYTADTLRCILDKIQE